MKLTIDLKRSDIMKRSYFAAVLILTTSSLAGPAFASGYGPAPYYRAEEGAPVSQSGMRSMSATVDATLSAGSKTAGTTDMGTAADERVTEADQTRRSQP
jgi:hypothetical protein